MKKINIFKTLAASATLAMPIATLPINSCASVKTIKLDWTEINQMDEIMTIDQPTTISSRNGSKIKFFAKQRYLTTTHAWRFILKNKGHIIGGSKIIVFDSVEPTEGELEIDWSKVNDGDTIKISTSWGLPMWSRKLNKVTQDKWVEGKLPPRPKYVYAGDDAILFGEPVTYGLIDDNSIYASFEKSKPAVTCNNSGFSLQFGMFYQIITQQIAYYIDGTPTSAFYGCIPMYEIEGNIYTASIMSPNNHVVSRVTIDADACKLTSIFISDYYSRDSRSWYPHKKTNIRPVYYYDDNLPGKFLSISLDGVNLEGKVDNIVLNTAQSIKITEVKSTDGAEHTGNFVFNQTDGTEIARSAEVTIHSNETATVSIELDDQARAAIKANDGKMTVTFIESAP